MVSLREYLLDGWINGNRGNKVAVFIYKSVSVFGACRKTRGISRRGGAADILTPVSVHLPGEPDKTVSI